MPYTSHNLVVNWTADKPPAQPYFDEIEARRRQWQMNVAGIEIIKSWLLLGNGNLIDVNGTDGLMEIIPDRLSDLARLWDQVGQAIGYTLSVGVGGDIGDAERARIIAKHRGGDRQMLWSDELLGELAESTRKDYGAKYDTYGDFLGMAEWDDEDLADLEKMSNWSWDLTKADPIETPEGKEPYKKAVAQPEPPQAGDQQAPPQEEEKQAPTTQTHEDIFHQHAKGTQAKRVANAVPQRQDLKQQVAQVLQEVKPQIAQLEGIKEQDPDAYQAILTALQAMATLAEELTGEGAPPEEEAKEG